MSKEAIEKKEHTEQLISFCQGKLDHDDCNLIEPTSRLLIQHTVKELKDMLTLGYVYPKFSEDLERAITELASDVSRRAKATASVSVESVAELIRNFLSANRLVQLAEDQSLPEPPYPHEISGTGLLYQKEDREMAKRRNPREYIYCPKFKIQAKNIEEAKPLVQLRLQQIIWHPEGIDIKDIKEVESDV